MSTVVFGVYIGVLYPNAKTMFLHQKRSLHVYIPLVPANTTYPPKKANAGEPRRVVWENPTVRTRKQELGLQGYGFRGVWLG